MQIATEGILIDGEPVTASERWACACSGGCGGEFSPRCARKGGFHYTEFRTASGRIVFDTFDWYAEQA
jgi:hypothetical protein